MWPTTVERPALRIGDAFADAGEVAAITRAASRMMHDGVVIHQTAGHVVYCNGKAAELLHMTTDEMLVSSLFDPRWQSVTLDGEPYPAERLPAMQAITTGAEVVGEIVGLRGGDGVLRWLSVDSAPIDLASGRHAITVFTDMTDALEGHRMLRQTREEIRRQLVQGDLPSTDRVRFVSASRSADPSRSIGGDFLGAYDVGNGHPHGDLAFFIGDVCGHGVLSAGLSGTARNTVRALAPVLDDPNAVLRQLHHVVEMDRPDCFLTALYGRLTIIDEGEAVLRLGCAGHPHPVLLRDGEAHPLGETGALIGMVPNSDRPVSNTLLQRGDRVIAFTDGVLDDAMPRRDLEQFCAELPVDESLDEIVAWMMRLASQRHEADPAKADDAAVLAFELT